MISDGAKGCLFTAQKIANTIGKKEKKCDTEVIWYINMELIIKLLFSYCQQGCIKTPLLVTPEND